MHVTASNEREKSDPTPETPFTDDSEQEWKMEQNNLFDNTTSKAKLFNTVRN